MEPAFADLVEHDRQLVLRIHLPGQPRHRTSNTVVIHRLVAIVPTIHTAGDAVDHPVVNDVSARRREEPQPVASNRATDRRVEVVDPVDHRHRVFLDAQVTQSLVPVTGLEVRGSATGEERPTELVSAFLRNHVHLHPAGLRLGGGASRRIRRLRRHHRVEISLEATIINQRIHHHPVDLDGGVSPIESTAEHGGLLGTRCAANVWLVHLDAGDEQRIRPQAATRRDRFLGLATQHLNALHLLDVDHRRLTRHRDRFLNRPNRERYVDIDRGVGRQD